ncbi:MAG TPA: TIGR00725 family protein [Candidatus Lokiarchaeia archaeon]|nr:TIGR00725 family protein [Candidatus Lokiarchaeia archaeon]
MSLKRSKTPIIAVCGGSSAPPEYEAIAETTGEMIAEEGWYLICGGLESVMAAACKGARKKNGLTIGILPDNDVSTANPDVEIPIATGVGYSRNAIIVQTADAVIAIDGKEGTLSEMCYALVFKKPVIVISIEETPVDMGGIRVDKQNSPGLVVVTDPRAAIEEIKKALHLEY